MAIQNRRGAYTNFDPTKMLPGEYAIVLSGDPSDTNGYAVYICFASGTVKRLVFADQLEEGLDEKQSELIFDTSPTAGSTNPVTSGGVKDALRWGMITGRPTISPGEGTGATIENDATNSAAGAKAHAENYLTSAPGNYSHAEGMRGTANGLASHAEGSNCKAQNLGAHAEGGYTTSWGRYSHTEGQYTRSDGRCQHVGGEYNAYNSAATDEGQRGQYVEIIGNGTSSSVRSNARTLDWDGNEVIAGKMTVGAAPTSDMDVATKKYVDDGLSDKQGTLTFDSAPTAGSQNPVRSSGIYEALSQKQNTLTFDSEPTQGSARPVTSGGIYSALSQKQGVLTFDQSPTAGSANPVTSGGVYAALAQKQGTLTFDTTPTENSSNPVTSGGIKSYVDGKSITCTDPNGDGNIVIH